MSERISRKPYSMQNLLVLMDPVKDAWHISCKFGNMFLNRFCIDEDAAVELSGIHFLKKWSKKDRDKRTNYKVWPNKSENFESEIQAKGKVN